MKVTKSGATFLPITITLETKEEADAMWHTLNCAPGTSLRDHCNKERLSKDAIDAINYQLFSALEDVHKP